MNQEQNLFKLLKRSNGLTRNNRSLKKEDTEAFKTLLHFLAIIELLKDLLDNEITAENFSYYFIWMHDQLNVKLSQMEREESVELANLRTKTDRPRLNRVIPRLYGSCDSFLLGLEIN